MKKSAVSLTEC